MSYNSVIRLMGACAVCRYVYNKDITNTTLTKINIMKFVTLSKPFTVPANDLFSNPTTFPVGKRFKITGRDFIHSNGENIVMTHIIIGGRFIGDVNIPVDSVTEKTLANFQN